MFSINRTASDNYALKIATISTVAAAMLICAGFQNLLILIGTAAIFGVTVVSFFRRFPLDMNRPTTPQIEKEMDDLRPGVITYAIGAIVYMDALMFLGVSGVVTIPGMTPFKLAIANVAAVLISLHVFSLQMPEKKRLTLTLCSSGFLLAFTPIACALA